MYYVEDYVHSFAKSHYIDNWNYINGLPPTNNKAYPYQPTPQDILKLVQLQQNPISKTGQISQVIRQPPR